jgi:hypothetical protein
VGPEDIHATVYKAMGLAEDILITDPLGRPETLFHGKPIEALL